MKVAGGPMNAAVVGSIRVTVGKDVGGNNFCEVDNWKEARVPHRRMQKPWTGCTHFLQNIGAPQDDYNNYDDDDDDTGC